MSSWPPVTHQDVQDKIDTYIGTTAPGTFRPIGGVNLANYATLKAAIAALPAGGGTVWVPVGRHLSGTWAYDTNYMDKANVKIVGEKMPRLSANCDRLEGGSVIEGRFNAFADGFEVENVGFDAGKYVIDTYWPTYDTHTANHPDGGGGSWDAFAFAQPDHTTPLAARKGVRIQNVIGLNRDPSSVGHAVLMEGIDGGAVDGVIGVTGVHGVVIKSQSVRVGRISGWACSTDNVILKSDTYAPCGGVTINSVTALKTPPGGVTPWWTAVDPTYGLLLNAVADFTGPTQIGTVRVKGAGTAGYGVNGSGIVADVQIGVLHVEGSGSSMTTGMDAGTARALGHQVGELIVNNSVQGLGWYAGASGDATANQLHIGTASLTDISTRGMNVGNYGRVVIDHLHIDTAPNAYYIEDTARVLVGKQRLVSVTTTFERSAPALTANWSNFGGGNSTFEVLLQDYGVEVKGLLSAASGASTTFANVPIYLRPPENLRMHGSRNGNAWVLIIVGSDGALSSGAISTGDYLSIDGVRWSVL